MKFVKYHFDIFADTLAKHELVCLGTKEAVVSMSNNIWSDGEKMKKTPLFLSIFLRNNGRILCKSF